jgi:hypothetical protein
MKLLLLFFTFLTVSEDLKKMRVDFNHMSKSEEVTTRMMDVSTNSKTISEPLKLAYYAASEMASAQYKFSPIAKLNTFNSGKKKLDKAALEDPTNIEIRYIRYAIQSNAPSFLGYNKSIKEDRELIFKNLSVLKMKDVDLFSHICAYLLTREKLSEAEKKQING